MIRFENTITKVRDEARGDVIVCGSHGGLYTGFLAAKAGVRAVIFNDAGGAKDNSGFASLSYLEKLGVSAATVSHSSCRIGDGEDMASRGLISRVNRPAFHAGVRVGDLCSKAASKLTAAPLADSSHVPAFKEARSLRLGHRSRKVVLIDSASLVVPEDEDQIVVTGSHGGLLGGDDFLALQVAAHAGVFHDAGIGADGAGTSRLPALDRRGIAGIAVLGMSARIGDAQSVYEEGIIGNVNETAKRMGATPGERLLDRLLSWS